MEAFLGFLNSEICKESRFSSLNLSFEQFEKGAPQYRHGKWRNVFEEDQKNEKLFGELQVSISTFSLIGNRKNISKTS